MQANPDKWQAIAVEKKTNISCDEVVKFLGIAIDYQLSFDQHIKNICRD
jgi:hypothetical protein